MGRRTREELVAIKEQILNLYEQGTSIKSMQEKYHVNHNTINKWIRENPKYARMKLEAEKKFQEDFNAITIRYMNGETAKALAKEYNLNEKTLRRRLNEKGIVKQPQKSRKMGEEWRNVEVEPVEDPIFYVRKVENPKITIIKGKRYIDVTSQIAGG